MYSLFIFQRMHFLFVFFMLLTIFSSTAYSQTTETYKASEHECCDTISIDDCYITIDGEKITIDTNVKQEENGLFSIEGVVFLYPHYCMLYVEKTDTIIIAYDSIRADDSMIYLFDTFFSTKYYDVLVEKEDEITGSLSRFVHSCLLNAYYDFLIESGEDMEWETAEEIFDEPIHLKLQRYYNVPRIPNAPLNNDNNNIIGTVANCDWCQIIILHGKECVFYGCPLFNKLYRLIP